MFTPGPTPRGFFLQKKYRRCRRYFSNAQKGRKGEKETGILNCKKGGVQGPEERECRRESESLGPLSNGLIPLTFHNVIQFI